MLLLQRRAAHWERAQAALTPLRAARRRRPR
jgi:hypothetical protein